MTYNPNIPQAGDLISQSQGQILDNFTVIDSNTVGFGLDHFQFSAGANQGKHKKSTYVEGADAPTAANEIALYSKDAATVTELFLRREGNGSVIQMTVGTPVVGSAGSTFLPGGVIIKWGTVQIPNAANTVAVSFAGLGIGNFPNNNFVAFASPNSLSAGLTPGNYPGTTNLATTGFNINRNGTSGALFYWFVAIGN